jgi:hypothetical protein
LLKLVAKEPDLTLDEIRARLRCEKKMKVAVSSIWRFYARHEKRPSLTHPARAGDSILRSGRKPAARSNKRNGKLLGRK